MVGFCFLCYTNDELTVPLEKEITMQKEFTKAEAERYLAEQAKDNDIVRLVHPMQKEVVSIEDDHDVPVASCFKVWGKEDRCENCTSLRASLKEDQAYKIELLNGKTYLVHSRYILIDGKGYVAEMVKDVSECLLLDSKEKDKISALVNSYNQMLLTDSLTSLFNRRFLDEQFVPSLHCCQDRHLQVNIAFVDVNDFKRINDAYGHLVGDELLKYGAAYFKTAYCSRVHGKERLVIRFGGDEFLVVACGISFLEFQSDFQKVSSSFKREVSFLGSPTFHFDFSVGFASNEELGPHWVWDDLVSLADRRMYDSKKLGKAPTDNH
jgi:two-component system cell cycle response regulator